jgi:L-aminopeptidase/D-esterase-like protein
VVRHGEVVVAALVAVNAFGDIDEGPPSHGVDDGTSSRGTDGDVVDALAAATGLFATTIGVVVTNAALDKLGCMLVAQAGHGGMARALVPAHTRFDGDALVVAATGRVAVGVDLVRHLGSLAVEEAIRTSVRPQ